MEQFKFLLHKDLNLHMYDTNISRKIKFRGKKNNRKMMISCYLNINSNFLEEDIYW